jgi:uncharacterized protein (TIRG00374 family)
MTAKRGLHLALSLSLAAYFSWLILRRIELAEIERAFKGTGLLWIAAALIAFTIGFSCRIERWRVMLSRDSPNLSWCNCAGPFVASFATNNVLPFRAGDALRSFVFNDRLRVSSGVVIATVFAERLLDLLTVLVLLGLAFGVFGMDTSRFFAGIGSAALIAAAALTLFMLLFPNCFAPIALALGRSFLFFSPKLGIRVLEEINKCLDTLRHLSQGNTMLKLIAWSLIAWLAEGGTYWFSALALPSITIPSAGWLALPVGTLATLIPSAPGYVGTFDYFSVRAMTELGNSMAAATAYALLVHAVLWVPPTIAGGLYLLLNRIKREGSLKAIRS